MARIIPEEGLSFEEAFGVKPAAPEAPALAPLEPYEPGLSAVDAGFAEDAFEPEKFFQVPEAGLSFEEAFGAQAKERGRLKAEEKEQSFLREVADIPLKLGSGVVQGVRFLSDFFGADNPVSTAMRGVENEIAELFSAQSKLDSMEVARIMREAEDKGILDQVIAGLRAVTVAPLDLVSQALGTSAPTIAAALLTTATGGAPALAATTTTAVGAIQGAGIAKSSIYDAVYDELKKDPNVTDEQARAAASEAQEYGGENLDSIVTAGV